MVLNNGQIYRVRENWIYRCTYVHSDGRHTDDGQTRSCKFFNYFNSLIHLRHVCGKPGAIKSKLKLSVTRRDLLQVICSFEANLFGGLGPTQKLLLGKDIHNGFEF